METNETLITSAFTVPAAFNLAVFLILLLLEILFFGLLLFAISHFMKLRERKLKTALLTAAIAVVTYTAIQDILGRILFYFMGSGMLVELSPAIIALLVMFNWLVLLLVNIFVLMKMYKLEKKQLILVTVAWSVAVMVSYYVLLPVLGNLVAQLVLLFYPPQLIVPLLQTFQPVLNSSA